MLKNIGIALMGLLISIDAFCMQKSGAQAGVGQQQAARAQIMTDALVAKIADDTLKNPEGLPELQRAFSDWSNALRALYIVSEAEKLLGAVISLKQGVEGNNLVIIKNMAAQADNKDAIRYRLVELRKSDKKSKLARDLERYVLPAVDAAAAKLS